MNKAETLKALASAGTMAEVVQIRGQMSDKKRQEDGLPPKDKAISLAILAASRRLV